MSKWRSVPVTLDLGEISESTFIINPLEFTGGNSYSSIDVNYTDLDANDATFDIGGSNFNPYGGDSTFTSLLTSPHVMDASDVTDVSVWSFRNKAENPPEAFLKTGGLFKEESTGNKSSALFSFADFPYKFMLFKITKGSVTDGDLKIVINVYED